MEGKKSTPKTCKIQITNAINEVNAAWAVLEPLKARLTQGNATQAERRITANMTKKLERKKEIIETYQIKFLEACDGDVEMDAYNKYITDAKVPDIIQRIDTEVPMYDEWALLETPIIQNQQHIVTSTPLSTRTEATSAPRREYAKLEPTKIPVFDGDLKQWRKFRDLFENLVIENPISDVEKMGFLITHVKGLAADVISGLAQSNDNFRIAWDLIKQQFDKRANPSHQLQQEVMNMKAVEESRAALRAVFRMRAIQRELEQEAIDISPIILTKLREILPSDCVATVIRQHRGKPTCEEFIETAADELSLRMSLEEERKPKEQEKPKDSDKRKEKLNSQHRENNNKTERKGKKCAFCEGDHFPISCDVYPTAEKRKEKVKELRCCWRCLKKNHKAEDCRNALDCFQCKGAHHTALCGRKESGEQPQRKWEPKKPAALTVVEQPTAWPMATKNTAIMMGTKMRAINGHQKRCIATLFDTGSHHSFLTRKTAEELSLKMTKRNTAKIMGFAGEEVEVSGDTCQLTLKLRDNETMKVDAYVVEKICGKVATLMDLPPRKDWNKTDWASHVENVQPELLIGITKYAKIITNHDCTLDNGLDVYNSKNGWIVAGEMKTALDFPIRAAPNLLTAEQTEKETAKICEALFCLDSLGVQNNEMGTVDEQVLKEFKSNVRKDKEGRYEVQLPWKEEEPNLPDNKMAAYYRLKAVLSKLQQNTENLLKYQESIDFQLQNGIIEEVPDWEVEKERLVHYLPHRAVIKSTSNTTKLRIVYDGSARAHKGAKSLNDCLHRGPVILSDLWGTLMRIRTAKIIISADVEKAFLQVSVNRKDRDVLRFLWVKDPKKPLTKANVKILRFKRLPFGLISSPFLLGAVMLHHLSLYESTLTNEIAENLYVDNIFVGAKTVEEAATKAVKMKEIFTEGKMNLREFVSNESECLKTIDANSRSENQNQKLLGIKWDVVSDTMRFEYPSAVLECPTPRKILENLASVFDPLGLMGPTVLKAKLIFQRLWTKTEDIIPKNKMSWDKPVSKELAVEWEKCAEGWEGQLISVQRRVVGNSQWELHAFSDASAFAYGAALYLRAKMGEEYRTTLIAAKSRVAPVNRKHTIPELELIAVLLALKLAKSAQDELKIDLSRTVMWSDSEIALKWIKSNKEVNSVFIRNRIKSIKTLPFHDFRHIAGEQNPADIASRGLTPSELRKSQLWWNGPAFLREAEERWPETLRFDLREVKEETMDEELHQEDLGTSLVTTSERDQVEAVDFTSRTNSWKKILRSGKVMLENLEKWNPTWKTSPKRSEAMYFRWCQSVLIQNEQKKWPPDDNLKKNLKMIKNQDGLWICQTRLSEADLADATKNPIFLHPKSDLTKKIIIYHHEQDLHGTVGTTLNALRRTFWVPTGRRTVSSCIRSECMKCKMFKTKPYRPEKYPQLPRERVVKLRPFGNIGVDLFGPITARSGMSNKERIKTYGIIFTCLNTRAIHLELLMSAKTEEVLRAFRKFTARRGIPKHVISDNGADLVAAAKVLMDEIQPVGEFIWKFNTPCAPWRGGHYERLIKIVKDALKRSLGRATLDVRSLETLFIMVEGTVNKRPIMQQPDTLEDFKVLRPWDFLNPMGNNLTHGTESEDTEADPTFGITRNLKGQLEDSWRYLNKKLDEFWERWNSEYLTSLRERERYEQAERRRPQIGDIVIVETEMTERNRWPLGIITKLIHSKDDKIRTVEIKEPNGRVIKRAVNLVHSLEISNREAQTTEEGEETHQAPTLITQKSDYSMMTGTSGTRHHEHIRGKTFGENHLLSQQFGAPRSSLRLKLEEDDRTIWISADRRRNLGPLGGCNHPECDPIYIKDVLNNIREETIRRIKQIRITSIMKVILLKANFAVESRTDYTSAIINANQEEMEEITRILKCRISERMIKEAMQLLLQQCKRIQADLNSWETKTIIGAEDGETLLKKPIYQKFAMLWDEIRAEKFGQKIKLNSQRIIICCEGCKPLTYNMAKTYTTSFESLWEIRKASCQWNIARSPKTIIVIITEAMTITLDDAQIYECIDDITMNVLKYSSLVCIWIFIAESKDDWYKRMTPVVTQLCTSAKNMREPDVDAVLWTKPLDQCFDLLDELLTNQRFPAGVSTSNPMTNTFETHNAKQNNDS